MKDESKIQELYSMIFNEKPDSETYELLTLHYKQNKNSIDSVENYLRSSEKFKQVFVKLEIELEIAELYYNILERMPDKEGLSFFKNQIIEGNKSLDWVKESILNSDEYKAKTS